MSRHVLDRLRLGFGVGIEDMNGLKLRTLPVFPLLYLKLAARYLLASWL